jgi:hypothetical protein
MRQKFLWARDTKLTRGNCKAAWTKVCMPTPRGGLGLGIVNLELFVPGIENQMDQVQLVQKRQTLESYAVCRMQLPVDDCDKR